MVNMICFCRSKWWKRVAACGLIVSLVHAAEDPRSEGRKRAREAEVQRAGVLKALSKKIPSPVKELPVFGSIEWTVKELPFVAKGPHGGISGAGMVVVDGQLYLLDGVTWTATARQRLAEALCYDPSQNQWKRLADFPIPMSGWSGDMFDRRHIIAVGGAGSHWNDVPFVYDTRSDRWMRIASPLPPGAVFNDPGVCIIGDTIYVAGGEGAGGSHFNHFLIGKIRAWPAAEAR